MNDVQTTPATMNLIYQSDLEDIADMLAWFRDFDEALRVRVAATMPDATEEERDVRVASFRRDALRSVRSCAVELGIESYLGVTPENLGEDAGPESPARKLARLVLAMRAEKKASAP